MKEYQAHTVDGAIIARCPQGSSEQEARLWFYREHEPRGAILVLDEFESEAEADKARLQFLASGGRVNPPGWIMLHDKTPAQHLNRFRANLDAVRNPTPAIITVIPTSQPPSHPAD